VPGLHLVERASAIDQDGPHLSDLLWFTSGREIEDRVLAELVVPCSYERVVLELEPPGGGAPGLARIARRTPATFLAARRALCAHKSEVFLGLGGFTSWPAALAARSLGIPVALLEINAASGRATRWVGPWAKRIFHAWPGTMPASDPKARHSHVGAPVSPLLAGVAAGDVDAAGSRRDLGFDPGRPLLLVLGGSQGAGSLNEFVLRHGEFILAGGVQILHQCGPDRRREGPPDGPGLRVEEYLSPVWRGLAAATLVLCRGGASTLAELAAARRPGLVVPYPGHADRHQERNAQQLGAGVRIVPDVTLDGALAAEIVELCGTGGTEKRAAMVRALGEAAPTDAALEVLVELKRLAEKRAR
jgi:UDP-N-acetylglucosamine--N-acetylmuramyl-(pentapeptide) pyrophosphoryl-undecaprenol N-acetylglucosamine transferase